MLPWFICSPAAIGIAAESAEVGLCPICEWSIGIAGPACGIGIGIGIASCSAGEWFIGIGWAAVGAGTCLAAGAVCGAVDACAFGADDARFGTALFTPLFFAAAPLFGAAFFLAGALAGAGMCMPGMSMCWASAGVDAMANANALAAENKFNFTR
ncbi:MAG: hypothetical protein ABIQ32_07535 [Sphingomicrobium sp.]